jgi:hypothetical protein
LEVLSKIADDDYISKRYGISSIMDVIVKEGLNINLKRLWDLDIIIP